jgi:thiamine-monophosphate kinase
MQLAVSTDMLVEGRHFLSTVDPRRLGHKALAVNLSDLAACGAQPLAFTLSLSMPHVDETWLAGFAQGLFALAEQHDCELVGGDTTRGPLNLCLTVFGDVPPALALRRDAARAGDDIWVSGMLGDARAGLGILRGEWPTDTFDAHEAAALQRALERPEPRVALGLALRGVAHAALDISDGLAGDLLHILERSRLDARVALDALPRSAGLRKLPDATQWQCAAAGGDDYELCFTAAPAQREAVLAAGEAAGVAVTRIGTITARSQDAREHDAPTIVWLDASGAPCRLALHGFDHFHAD